MPVTREMAASVMAVAKSLFAPHPLPLSRKRERGDSAAVCVRLPLSRKRERGLGGEGWRGNRTLQQPYPWLATEGAPLVASNVATAM